MTEFHVPGNEDWEELIDGVTASLAEVGSTNALIEDLEEDTAMQEYLKTGQSSLDSILMSLTASTEVLGSSEDSEPLSKLVLSRKTELKFDNKVDIFQLMQHLERLDPCSYQFCLTLPHNGGSFLGSSPERLYARQGQDLVVDAMAGSRPRGAKGNIQEDFLLGLDLLRSPKDHIEFTLVRDWLRSRFLSICKTVDLEIPKSLIKKQSIQHLYGRLTGVLEDGIGDLELLETLHPTPAVCGRPRGAAKERLRVLEGFDRGFFAGPVGRVSGNGAEFAVAIRSALFQDAGLASIFAGVGIVKDSRPSQEWNELELKISPFKKYLSPKMDHSGIAQSFQATSIIIEELVRCGIQSFGIAPGSRSSPLVYAIASNAACEIQTCIDERVLSFWSLGFGKATNTAAPVVTSSGTAVGNLLPAVIEASLSWIPMLLLTADRPADLRNTRANQTIDQVKIFGDYVRYFHDIPAEYGVAKMRSLLTLIDSAVLHSCSNPPGPVHLNFQFEEPLAPVPGSSKIQQQDPLVQQWWSSGRTYTQSSSTVHGSILEEALDVQSVHRGLIIVGELRTKEERTAIKKLTSFLGWPTVVDILSGLKSASEDFIVMADQVLSENKIILEMLRPDCILQIGGHLTSKRLMRFLEQCRETDVKLEWILVSPYPLRDDPRHLVTKQITIPIPALIKSLPGDLSSNKEYLGIWKSVDEATRKILKKRMLCLSMQEVPNEPYVAYLVAKKLPEGHGMFLGNGMPIRDVEMFIGVAQDDRKSSISLTGANRGASGIDGVMSTAIGFAFGAKQSLTLLIGDLSFLHDSNALTLLQSQDWPPMTIVVINNQGGGIFDFLPIAQAVPTQMYDALWSTPQYFNIGSLCEAHGVPYQQVVKTEELEGVLDAAWRSNRHCVVEVKTDRKQNVQIHRELKSTAEKAVQRVVNLMSCQNLTLSEFQWSSFCLPLTQSITTGVSCLQRRGIYIQVTLKGEKGLFKGLGEIAPLPGLHEETLEDIEAQLQLLQNLLKDLQIPSKICLMNGAFDELLMNACGISVHDLAPSLRFGLSSAVLNAFANSMGCQLHQFRNPVFQNTLPVEVSVNGLMVLDPEPLKSISKAQELIKQGYKTIKIKVGRSKDPLEETEVINQVSEALGSEISIRLDANQHWSLQEALNFASKLNCPNLEYIEEPISDPGELGVFHETTGLPIGLDESLNSISSIFEVIQILNKSTGVVACVLKPSRVGSMDQLMELIEIGEALDVKMIISSAFESPLGLSVLMQLAGGLKGDQVHGLSTCSWFESSLSSWRCLMRSKVSLEESWKLNQSFQINSGNRKETKSLFKTIKTDQGIYKYHIMELSPTGDSEKSVLVFFHGFLGSSRDWRSIMDFFSEDYHCLAVDLPGHGLTELQEDSPELFDFNNVVKSLRKLLKELEVDSCSLIGYSMGARLASALVSSPSEMSVKIEKLVLVSGNLGIQNPVQRAARLVQDSNLASALCRHQDLEEFLVHWYENNSLWSPLRRRTILFHKMLKRRTKEGDSRLLSQALMGMSTGKMQYLEDALQQSPVEEIVFIFGELDAKMQCIAKRLRDDSQNRVQIFEVEDCGHAVQLEAPLKLCRLLARLL